MADILQFNGITRLDLPPDRVLENCQGKLEGVVILGWTLEGNEFFASSYADGGDALWLLERAKMALLSVPEHMEAD